MDHEPSLVPQWLRGGGKDTVPLGGISGDSSFDPALRKSPFSSWDSAVRRPAAADHPPPRSANDKSWKPASSTQQRPFGAPQRDAFASSRDGAGLRDLSAQPRDGFSKLAGSGLNGLSRPAPRPSAFDSRPSGFADRSDDYGAGRARPGFGPRPASPGGLHRTESAPEGRLRDYHAEPKVRSAARPPARQARPLPAPPPPTGACALAQPSGQPGASPAPPPPAVCRRLPRTRAPASRAPAPSAAELRPRLPVARAAGLRAA
jgi:hypothetical protein